MRYYRVSWIAFLPICVLRNLTDELKAGVVVVFIRLIDYWRLSCTCVDVKLSRLITVRSINPSRLYEYESVVM